MASARTLSMTALAPICIEGVYATSTAPCVRRTTSALKISIALLAECSGPMGLPIWRRTGSARAGDSSAITAIIAAAQIENPMARMAFPQVTGAFCRGLFSLSSVGVISPTTEARSAPTSFVTGEHSG
jgi:hypothetical protein